MLGSAGLNVSDLDRSILFYREALGFDLVRRGHDRGHGWAHLGTGDHVLLTLWEQALTGPDERRAGLHHLSFELATALDLAEAEERLRRMGARMRGSDGQVQAPTGAVFFRDPDGIRVELYTEEITAPAGPGDPPRCGFYEELEDPARH